MTKQTVLMLLLLSLLLPGGAAAGDFRGVVAQKGDQTEFISEFGAVYEVENKVEDKFLNTDVVVTVKNELNRNYTPDVRQKIRVNSVKPYQERPDKKVTFAKTNKKLPESEIQSGKTVTVELPELGKSASSGNQQPIKLEVTFPPDYQKDRAYPVILHFAGGMGGPGEAQRYRQITEGMGVILAGADYNYGDNEKKDLLKLGTCRDFDNKIALNCLQIIANTVPVDTDCIILSGFSSGAYSITDNFANANSWKVYSGYCAISGGSKIKPVPIGNRPILFAMGANDTIRHKWLDEAVAGLKTAKAANLTVKMIPGTGHEWNDATSQTIREWLIEDFPQMQKKSRLQKAVAETADDQAKKVLESYLAD